MMFLFGFCIGFGLATALLLYVGWRASNRDFEESEQVGSEQVKTEARMLYFEETSGVINAYDAQTHAFLSRVTSTTDLYRHLKRVTPNVGWSVTPDTYVTYIQSGVVPKETHGSND